MNQALLTWGWEVHTSRFIFNGSNLILPELIPALLLDMLKKENLITPVQDLLHAFRPLSPELVVGVYGADMLYIMLHKVKSELTLGSTLLDTSFVSR